MSEILNDLLVIELSSVLAGPLAGSFFAEHGARVIKIENAQDQGDVTRKWKLPSEDAAKSVSAYYSSANFGKEVIMLDLSLSTDYSVLIELVKKADVVISNFQKNTAEKLKVDFHSLEAYNKTLIYAQLAAYTYDDPRPGYDLIMQAEAGYISMTGGSDHHLAKMPVAMIDVIAGHQLKEAILLGIIDRLSSKKGCFIEVSLFKSAISGLANQASNFLMENHIPIPMGTLHPNIAPYGDIIYTASKERLILAIGSDKQFEKLGKTLKLAEKLLHTFKFNKVRVSRRSELMDIISRKCGTLSSEFLLREFKNAKIPFCTVANLSEVFENQLAKEMILEQMIDDQKTYRVSNTAFAIKKM